MQVSGENGNGLFAILSNGENLFDGEIRRALFVGHLRLEFERDVAPETEPSGLGRRTFEDSVEQAPLLIQLAKSCALDRRRSFFNRCHGYSFDE